MKPIRQEDTKMKTSELKVNMMEKVNGGGNFFADLEEVLRNIFQDPAKRNNPAEPKKQDVTARGKC